MHKAKTQNRRVQVTKIFPEIKLLMTFGKYMPLGLTDSEWQLSGRK